MENTKQSLPTSIDMYNYFKAKLKELKLITGSNQYLEILSLATDDEKRKARHALIESLVTICKSKFAYIPDAAKQKIISEAILTDPDFVKNGSLNAKFVYKHLMIRSDAFYHELSHEETNKVLDAKGIPLSECKPEIQAAFKETLNRMMDGMQEMPQVSESEIQTIVKEDKKRTEKPKSLSAGFQSRTKRKEYIRMLRDEGFHRWADIHEKKNEKDLVYSFKIENQFIVAKDETEAQEIFLEVYG